MQYTLTPQHLEIVVTTGARMDVELALGELLAHEARADRLDLVGHATRDKLLALGDWVVDATNKKARALFRELAEQGVLARLGIQHVRLVGSLTGATERGRTTLDTLTEILGIPVTGMPDLACYPHCLAAPTPRNLDLDAVPTRQITPAAHVLSPIIAREVLSTIRRDAGLELRGLLALPHAQLALPGQLAGTYHHVDVLLDYDYVRVAGDLVFPVDDPRALRHLIER